MTQWTSPSGSRWEPVPQDGWRAGTGDPTLPDGPASTRNAVEHDQRLRSRRSPVLVALVALLSIGAVSAGAYEEVARSRNEGTSVGTPAGAPPAAGEPGTHGGHEPGRGYGDHHRGQVGGSVQTGPGTGASS